MDNAHRRRRQSAFLDAQGISMSGSAGLLGRLSFEEEGGPGQPMMSQAVSDEGGMRALAPGPNHGNNPYEPATGAIDSMLGSALTSDHGYNLDEPAAGAMEGVEREGRQQQQDFVENHDPHGSAMEGVKGMGSEEVDVSQNALIGAEDADWEDYSGLGITDPAELEDPAWESPVTMRNRGLPRSAMFPYANPKELTMKQRVVKTVKEKTSNVFDSTIRVGKRIRGTNMSGPMAVAVNFQNNLFVNPEGAPPINPTPNLGNPREITEQSSDDPSRKSKRFSAMLSRKEPQGANDGQLPTIEDRLRHKRGKSMQIKPIGHPEMTDDERNKRDQGIYYGKSLKELKDLFEARRCFPHSHFWPPPGPSVRGLEAITPKTITYYLQEQDKELTAQDPFTYTPITTLMKRSASRVIMSSIEDKMETVDAKIGYFKKKMAEVKVKVQDKLSKK